MTRSTDKNDGVFTPTVVYSPQPTVSPNFLVTIKWQIRFRQFREFPVTVAARSRVLSHQQAKPTGRNNRVGLGLRVVRYLASYIL